MTDFPSFQRHVTASRLKIHQQQQPPDKTFPFLLMAFVFDHVTRLGLGAMSPTAPSGNWLRQKGLLSRGKEGGGTASQLTTLTNSGNSSRRLHSRLGWSEPGEVFSTLRRVLLTEWVMWCSKRKGPNQVSPPVHCGSAFCAHYRTETSKRTVCHMQHSDGECLENPMFTLESAENTRHTYISLRCCSLENIVLSSTCNLLWLRSLWRKKKKGKIMGKVYTTHCSSQLQHSTIWVYMANIIT